MSLPRSKPWGGRFRQATDAAVERFTASIHFDQALATHDVRASMAHERMLRKQGLVGEADEAALLAGLESIGAHLDGVVEKARTTQGVLGDTSRAVDGMNSSLDALDERTEKSRERITSMDPKPANSTVCIAADGLSTEVPPTISMKRANAEMMPFTT